MGWYCLFKVCDLANSNLPKYTHKQWFYAVADSTDLAVEDKEDAGEEDNGTVIHSFTGNDAKSKGEKERKRKAGKFGRKS